MWVNISPLPYMIYPLINGINNKIIFIIKIAKNPKTQNLLFSSENSAFFTKIICPRKIDVITKAQKYHGYTA